LGILKAGGAYVPLEAGQPEPRQQRMMEEAGIAVVVTAGEEKSALGVHAVAEVDVEEEAAAIRASSAARPGVKVGGENLAYVIYTSGSTGKPKGVSVTHRGVLRLVRNSDYVQIGAGQRIAQAATASFDAATFEVWGGLLNGGRVEVMSREQVLALVEYVEEVKARGIEVMFVTTALLNEMARQVEDGLRGIGVVLFGGEAVEVKRVRELQRKGRPQRLLHVYGPTENTTFTTWEEVGEVEPGAPTIAIGRAIANTEVY